MIRISRNPLDGRHVRVTPLPEEQIHATSDNHDTHYTLRVGDDTLELSIVVWRYLAEVAPEVVEAHDAREDEADELEGWLQTHPRGGSARARLAELGR